MEEVLSRPEYAEARPGLLQRAFERVVEALVDAFDGAAGTGAGRVAGLVVLAVVVAALAWLAVRALRRIRLDRAGDVRIEQPTGRSPGDWLAEADDHEAAGDLRAGLRCRYRALVALLAERGVVDEVPGTTTGEYRTAVEEALPDAAEPFGAVTVAFEHAWYGRRSVTRSDVDAVAAAAARVRAAVDAPAGSRT